MAVVGNLVWSRTGRVWAVWRVPATPYLWLPDRRKLAEHGRVRALLAALPAESMILSVAARIDPGEVAEAMAQGIDLGAHPGWAATVEGALDELEGVDLYRRRHYLCVELPDRSGSGGLGSLWRTASGPVRNGFGLAAPLIPGVEFQRAVRRAEEIRSQLRALRLDTPSAGEIRWLYARAPRRGLPGEPPLAGWHEPHVRYLSRRDGQMVATPSLGPLLEANLRNGGHRSDADRPWHRRYLRIETDEGVSYQSTAVVADAPQHFAFPGGLSEWLMVADQLPFPLDWACRIRAVPNQAATRAATRQQRELAGQLDHYEAEPAGPPPSLAAAMDAVDDQRAQLAASPAEPELQVSMLYSVAAEDLAELEQRMAWLRTLYQGAEYHLAVPTGGQLLLWEAMLPGSSTPGVCRDYRQYLLPRDLAAGMPFAGVELGDEHGLLLGTSRDAGCARPVLVDPAAGPRQDRDGSIAAFGALGTGKSYLAKRLAAAVVQRGGQMLMIDRTEAGEYVRFAHAMTAAGIDTQVVTVGAKEESPLLDPLRVFDAPDAAQVAIGYLGMLCGTDPTSLEAATLTRAVQVAAESGDGLPAVLGALDGLAIAGREHRHARELSLRLAALAENRYAAPAWSDGPALDFTADCIVVHLPGLAVPSREVLLSEHLSRKLTVEQVCSLGLLYLVAALARRVAYRHRHRYAGVLFDEAWALTHTLAGQQLLLDVLRDGRKHNAAAWVFSQHPDDLPRELRDLTSTRFLFGLTGNAAPAGLGWLGVEPSADNVDLLEQWASRREPSFGGGRWQPDCLLRDAAGRIGHVAVADAETDALHQAFESNPTRLAADPEATTT